MRLAERARAHTHRAARMLLLATSAGHRLTGRRRPCWLRSALIHMPTAHAPDPAKAGSPGAAAPSRSAKQEEGLWEAHRPMIDLRIATANSPPTAFLTFTRGL